MSSIWEIGAFGETSEFLYPGSPSQSTAYYHNGLYWYWYSGKSVGFASVSEIWLNSADTSSDDCDWRLSWHLDQSSGGWRVGCVTGLNGDVGYYKYILTGPCSGVSLTPPSLLPTVSP